jgi:hypothetical protein
MRICHIGHGVLTIPPKGWGAVESLIWDYKYWIEQLGHECVIVNARQTQKAAEMAAALRPDIVHIHCEQHFGLAETVGAKASVLCSHWPWLFEPEQQAVAVKLFAGRSYVACLSERVRQGLLDLAVTPQRLFLAKNGARSSLYRINDAPKYPGRSICLAAIRQRKRQHLIQSIDSVDFVGPRGDPRFDSFDYSRPNYLGEWSKEKTYCHLTDYANLVLLSRAEVAPLVTCEALMSGLGVVVSEAAAANLDTTQAFVTVIPEARIIDTDYVKRAIESNRRTSLGMRREIREYALAEFDWSVLVREYLKTCEQILNAGTGATELSPAQKPIR